MCVSSTPSSWEIRIPCWLAHIYQMGGETTMEHFCLMRTSNHIIREWLDMIGLSNHFLSIAFSFHAPILRRWLDPKKGLIFFDEMGAITQNFRYLKWGILKEPYFRLFWGGGFKLPYISRIHTAYIGEDSSILGTWKCLVTQLCLSCFFHLGGTKKPFITSWGATCPQVSITKVPDEMSKFWYHSLPDDSSRDLFNPYFGGHLAIERLTNHHPKKVTAWITFNG